MWRNIQGPHQLDLTRPWSTPAPQILPLQHPASWAGPPPALGPSWFLHGSLLLFLEFPPPPTPTLTGDGRPTVPNLRFGNYWCEIFSLACPQFPVSWEDWMLL